MAGTGGTTSYSPISLLTGTTLLPPKPTAPKPAATVTPKPATTNTLSQMMGSSGTASSSSTKKPAANTLSEMMGSSGSAGSASAKKPTTNTLSQMMGSSGTAKAATTTKAPTVDQKKAINSLAGLDAAAAKMPGQSKAAIANQFIQALSAAAKEGKAVPNPAGLTAEEADKYRSQFYTQFYSGQPVQQIVDNTAIPTTNNFNAMFPTIKPSGPQAPLPDLSSPLYQVGQFSGAGVTPALGNMGGGEFGVMSGINVPYMGEDFPGTGMTSSFGMYPQRFDIGAPDTRALGAAMSPQQITPPTVPYGRGIDAIGMPQIDYGNPATVPYGRSVIPGPMPQQQYVAPGNQVIAQPRPTPAPAGGGYTTDMLNSKGIARYLLSDMMGKQQPAAPAIVAQQQGGGFDPLSLLVGQAQGADLPANYGQAPTTRTVPTMTYTGKPAMSDVLLAQLATGVGLGSDKDRLTLANPFYQAGRVGATDRILGDAMLTPEATMPNIGLSPMTSSFVPGGIASLADLNEVMTPRRVAAQPFAPSPMEDALIAQGIKPGIPMSLQDPSGQGRLVTDPATGITQEAGSTLTVGYDPLLSYEMLAPFRETAAGAPAVAAVVPRERPSLFDFAVSNPGWAIERMRAIEDAGTMADNSDYGNLLSGLENSPYRTADMMSQGAKLRAAEEYAKENGIEVSDTYGGPEDKTDQLLQIYEDKVEPNLTKAEGTTAGSVFKPGPGQFVGTNGYVYEQSADGGFARVGKVPGYTDAQLYEAANAGAFRNPQAAPVGASTKKPAKKPSKKKTDEKTEGGGFFQWLTDTRKAIEEQRDKNREALGLEPRKADGGMVKAYKKGGSATTTNTTSGAPAGYTPPTQAQIDALYAPYFQQAVMPPSTYVPGVSGEFNYFPTVAAPVVPGTPTPTTNTAASDWFTKYMNAKNRADKQAAKKIIATGDKTFYSLFHDYRDSLGRRDEPSLDSWLKWYSSQKFATGGAVREPRLVLGHGGPKEDKIPASIDGVQEARLSNGEFVMTAAAVKNAGDGDMELGAKRLMDLNEMLSYGRPASKLNVENVKGKAR